MACQEIGGNNGIIRQFNVEHHEEIQRWSDEKHAAGRCGDLCIIPLKLFKQVFYHADSSSLYHAQGALQAAIDDKRAASAVERSTHAVDPLTEVTLETATDDEQLRGLHRELALDHFKEREP